MDLSVIKSLEKAVEQSPYDYALRLHLTSLLLDAGRAKLALDHCLFILSSNPNHPEALGLAIRAAEASSEYGTAADLRDQLTSLGDGVATSEEETARFRQMIEEFKEEPLAVEAEAAVQTEIGEVESPRITLEQVAGMEDVKRRLNVAFLGPLRNSELRKLYGKSLRGGLLLYGPPGCGKTFIARATAGEIGARFMSVGLSDVLDMWLGKSEQNVHEIFETARRMSPCVLFLDEVDALGQKRSHLRYSAGRGVVNQLLSELDGADGNNEGVFVLAASNHPWDIDTALRRPGRLDRMILVLPPDRPAREAVVNLNLRDRPTTGLDAAQIARETEAFSGADLAHLCESAVEYALEESLETGRARPVTMADFKRALREVRPSTSAWFDMAKNFAMFSNEGGMYDDLLDYMRKRKIL